MPQSLRIAYTPDPDDAFHYCALETGRLALPPGLVPVFTHGHIKDLNESCLVETYDVCAISSVFYPAIADRYVIMASGASVGRDYGPVLGGRPGLSADSLAGRRVAVPGTSTTGYFLLRYFYEGYRPIPMPFDQVADAIMRGDVDAGVLIHEELLNFPERRIEKICCLGHRWFEHTALPPSGRARCCAAIARAGAARGNRASATRQHGLGFGASCRGNGVRESVRARTAQRGS